MLVACGARWEIAMHKTARYFLVVASLITPASASADVLTVPNIITVLGTDVFSGPSFTVSGAFGPDDSLALTAAGVVDLANGFFTANAAGIVVQPDPTNTGAVPGGTTLSGGFPYAALMIGNLSLGFRPFFTASAANGLGDPTPPTTLTESRLLSDLFGGGFTGFLGGEQLQFRINDINTGDNTGSFRVSPGVEQVPEPASLLLLGTAAGFAVARYRRRFRP
jgi:hypothetical protein